MYISVDLLFPLLSLQAAHAMENRDLAETELEGITLKFHWCRNLTFGCAFL